MTISAQDLQDIQGAALGRFRKDHQDLLFVRFGGADGTRRLLAQLGLRVANAWEVQLFNQLFSEIAGRAGEGVIEATWVALGISASGYSKLGVNLQELGTSEGASAFRSGMAARSAQQIGDGPADQPAEWLDAFKPGAGVDAVLIVAADDVDDLDQATDALVKQIQDAGAEIVYRERGATLAPPLVGHEHFGFKDGISQPAIDGFDPAPATGEPPAMAPGQLILGQPDSSGTPPALGSLWRNGTYGVFRRLRQDVAAFRYQAQALTGNTSPTLTADQIAADLVGRWQSGAPLATSPSSDPGPSAISNAFDFSDDVAGQNTPRFAHIRKVNPRNEQRPDASSDSTANHRMTRAGIPYGDPLPPGAADDGADRGLHFIAFMADIDQSFEFVQRQWANNPNFPNGGAPATPGGAYTPPQPGTPPDGCDPVIGTHNPGDTVSLDQAGAVHALPLLAETVRVTAGEYFFHPSLSAIAALATGATSSTAAPTT